MRGKTRALTIASLCAALGTVLLALSLVLPAQRLALLCLSSLAVVACLCENGNRWAIGTYAVTSLLSLLLLPEKGAPLAYALFCGYYPILKIKLETIPNVTLRYALKLLCFNLAFGVLLLLTAMETSLPLWALFLGANGALLLYDYALGKLIILYLRKIAGRINHE